MDTDEFIAATMRRVADSAEPPPHALVTPAPARRRWLAPLAVAAAAAVVAAVVVVSTAGPDPDPPASGGPAGAPTDATCGVDYPATPLPTWARTGFTPPGQPVSYVLGDAGDMAAIVWAEHRPLVSPPAASRNNKILWVARVDPAAGPLEIRATLAGTDRTVTRTVAPAPGPSTVDLPAAGCWSLDLRWGSHDDHLLLGYAAG